MLYKFGVHYTNNISALHFFLYIHLFIYFLYFSIYSIYVYTMEIENFTLNVHQATYKWYS